MLFRENNLEFMVTSVERSQNHLIDSLDWMQRWVPQFYLQMEMKTVPISRLFPSCLLERIWVGCGTWILMGRLAEEEHDKGYG